MSGPWQQYPLHPGVYQQPGSYGPTPGYPQPGYPQPGYHQPGPHGAHGGQAQYGPYGRHGPSQAPQHPHMIAHGPQYPHMPSHGQQYPQPGTYAPVQQPAYPAHPPHMPPSASPVQNNCFNCGAPDHWAQNCPEPKRAIPFGQMHQQNRGPKRFKPNYKPPIVTKYAVPQHLPQPQQTSPYTTSPGWSQPNQPYPTPSSTASSPSRSSWPGPNPQQHFSQTRVQQHPITEAQPAQVPSPALRRPSYQTSDILTPPYGSEQGHTQEQPSQNASQSGDQRKNSTQGESAPMSRRLSNASTDQSVSMESDSEDEDESEEYNLLDIPDLPDLNCYAGAKQPCLVTMPLPALLDSDELDKLVRPENGSLTIKSRYHSDSASEAVFTHFSEYADFEVVQADPLFRRVRSESPIPKRSPSPQQAPTMKSTTPPATLGAAQVKSSPVAHRPSTPMYKEEDTDATASKPAFDPFDPSTGDLEHLIRKHYPDAGRNSVGGRAPPPPPPPPPPPDEPYYNSRSYYEPNLSESPRTQRHHSNLTMNDPEADATGSRKRSLDDQGSSHRSGSTRQREASGSKRRRSSQKVVDVHSRRW